VKERPGVPQVKPAGRRGGQAADMGKGGHQGEFQDVESSSGRAVRSRRTISRVCHEQARLSRPFVASPRAGLRKGRFAMDAELKRDARGVIDRIVQLRDSL
jgi:hypothetical protein